MRAASVAARALVALAAGLAAGLGAAGAVHAGEATVPPRFFGVMWDQGIQNAPAPVQADQWEAMEASGVESARVIFGWHLAQARRSHKPNFVRADQMVANAARNGIDLLPVVMYAPRWARVVPTRLSSAPKDLRAYGHYVSELVRRYGRRGYFWRRNPDIPRRPIRAWQLWNEPHLEYQLSPHRGWQKRYAKLLRTGYRAVKRRDRRATVVLAGFANDAWRTVASVHRRRKLRRWYDVAALHMYSADTADYVEILRRFRAAIDRHGARRKPIWVTEIGASASRAVYESPGHEYFQVTDDGLAALVPRTYRAVAGVRRRFRVERAYWYTWASPYDRAEGVFAFAGLNAFKGGVVQPRPALAAYRATVERYR